MNIITSIKNWFSLVGSLQKEIAKLEAYVKALEAKVEPELVAKVAELETVLEGWRSHALNLAKTLEEKVKADLEKL